MSDYTKYLFFDLLHKKNILYILYLQTPLKVNKVLDNKKTTVVVA